MKKNYKNLIFPVLALVIFIPLVSMAADNSSSFSEKGQRAIKHRQSSLENFNSSLVDKDARMAEREDRRLENRAKHEEMIKVLESGDYNAWLEFVKDKECPMFSEISEENFSEFVKMHKSKLESRESQVMEKNNHRQSNFNLKRK